MVTVDKNRALADIRASGKAVNGVLMRCKNTVHADKRLKDKHAKRRMDRLIAGQE